MLLIEKVNVFLMSPNLKSIWSQKLEISDSADSENVQRFIISFWFLGLVVSFRQFSVLLGVLSVHLSRFRLDSEHSSKTWYHRDLT